MYKTVLWKPCEELMRMAEVAYAVVVLNTPLGASFSIQLIKDLWVNAKIRHTVDGGTIRWLNCVSDNIKELNDTFLPDLVTGDMDSLSEDIIKKLENCSTIIKTPNQNETDFTKGIRELTSYCCRKEISIDTIFVLSDSSGRFDQIMANINTLFKARNITEANIFLIASNSITWLLEPNVKHVICIPNQLRDCREWCGLIPIGAPCKVRTNGLKWDLDNQTLEFGKLVSTSNTYSDTTEVTVEADGYLVWTMGIDNLF